MIYLENWKTGFWRSINGVN